MSNEKLLSNIKELNAIIPDKEDEKQAFREEYSKLTILEIGD
ncbi:hypothetical protein [Peribacillus frigoritolerans]|nr:hypothetical protein [Peribacillus frigoritolerans]